MPNSNNLTSARRATLSDVARRARVSTSAVSRTFTPGASVSPKTRARVLKAAKEVGFQPNVLARSLTTGRTHMIALVTNAFPNPYISTVIDIFSAELQDRRLIPLVFNLSGDFDWEQTVDLILQYQVDGVIIASSTVDQRFLERLHDAKIHLIQAFGRYLGDREIDSVFVDNEGGGRRAAEEFLARGYRAPGFIGAPSTVSTTHDRLSGFSQALAEAGITPQIARTAEYSYDAGYAQALALFQAHPDLDSVFCADDLIGLGTLDALRFELGRDIPEVGVIGFNNIVAAGWQSHPLASFCANTGQVVLDAIGMLTDRIEAGEKPGEKRIVSCQFVERGSVRPRPEELGPTG